VKALLITSLNERAGKTMLCAGLGKYWRDSGRKIGYFKPNFFDAEKTASEEKSLALISRMLGLAESMEVLSPRVGGDAADIQAAFKIIAANKDIVLIEGSFAQAETLSSATGAGIIAVHDYAMDLGKILPEYAKLSKKMVGVIINKVPVNKLAMIVKQSDETLLKAGLKLLGAVQEKRILVALSIGELAEALEGKILNNPEKVNELIENYMVGSSTFDRGAAYYQRKSNKAVLIWGERPGFRKAAVASLPQLVLQTSTRCIIISDSATPLPAMIQKAEEKRVPLISAPGKLSEVITKLEKAMGGACFAQDQKMLPLLEILPKTINLNLLTADPGS
jgi:BioD-like phosphotransacetylase family protein